MRHARIVNFALAALIGLAAGLPVRAPAEDIEIYTGGNIAQSIRPNVLFILDTSGSMSSFDGESKDRLDRMKDALFDLLDNVDNVNIGLMRFTDPGGPILFPVAGVDGDATAIDQAGQPDVNVRVADDDDDAEELVALGLGSPATTIGQVKLDSLYLEIFDTPAFATELSRMFQVDDDSHDAEQSETFYNNSSTTLETVFTTGNTRTVGFRFENFPADTQSASVLLATLGITSKDERAGDLDLKIFGLYRGDMDPFPGGGRTPPGCPAHASADIYCRLGLDTNAEYNTAPITFANVGNYSHTTGTGDVTDAIVTWNDVPSTVANELIESPDVGPVLEEIFSHPQWHNGAGRDDLGIFYTGTTASRRDVHSHDSSSSRAATLQVDYVPAGAPYGRQLIALRFRNVNIPQGATIETAGLELFSAGESADPVSIRIRGEKVADAPAFLGGTPGVDIAAADRLSSRLAANPTAAQTAWNVLAAETWTHELPVQSPEIKDVIQEIVGQSGWCGGNDLVLFVEFNGGGAATRRVYAHDADPSLAPTLRVDYDQTGFSAGQGCTVQEITRRVAADNDDAEQDASAGTTWTTSTTMEMTTTGSTVRTNGVIFRNMPIPPRATIESATVEFTAKGTFSAGAASVTVRGDDDDQVQAFASSQYNISNRITSPNGTAASASFSIPPAAVNSDDRFETPNVSAIVQELVDSADWDQGDDIGLVFTGSGRVDLRTHDDDPAKAALLRVRVRYNVGDVLGSGSTPGTITVRERMKELIDDLTHDGWTPIVDTLYEAARYFRGERLLYGASRGDGGASVEQNTRLSHPGSYEHPGTNTLVNYPAGCNEDDSNLSDPACRDQTISGPPFPKYISPIEESCQTNFLVLLTDGFANHNHSQGLIRNLTGISSCQSEFENGDSISDGEACGLDIVEFLHDNDQSSSVTGDNNVVTYTIGFNISNEFLKDMAIKGGGKFYEAQSSAQLSDVFQQIIADVLSRATSFAAPSLSVNAFNRLEDRNEIYFSLFEPAATAAWSGNIKKFELCRSTADNCGPVGSILDEDGAIAVGADGRILEDANSFWAPLAGTDGPEVMEGGTGNLIPGHASRRVFTLSDEAKAPTGLTGTVTFYPSSQSLGDQKNLLRDTDGDGIIDGLTGTAAERLTQTRELLGMGSATTAELNEQIDWIRSKDVDGQFADSGFSDNRYAFGDPLHGNPLAITFGGTEAAPIIKVIAGTNDGGIRMINSYNGAEEWVFFPPAVLTQQTTLRANPTTGKVYGIDGSPVPWVRDTNTIGVIEPDEGDFVRVFVGMRRGGNNYYALDVTPANTIPAANLGTTNEITPKIMWRIRGGTPEFPRLGQTWSTPQLATMLVGTANAGEAERRSVLIFTGGYEEEQDGGFMPANNLGNAIYVVDAATGERLFYVSSAGSAEHGAGDGLVVDDMIYPIPSDVAGFDSDGDGAVDRLYVGDTGGQLWRIDFAPDRAASSPGIIGSAGKLGVVSSDTAEADERKFFYPPTVIQVRGPGSFSNADYDLVGIVTGNRASPLDVKVRDRFYAFRDYNLTRISPASDTDGDGVSNTYTTIRGDLDGDPMGTPAVPATTYNDMLDFTSVNGPSELADPSDFTTANGYYIRLDTGGAGSGEKGLAAPTTLAGKLFFTTYLPEGVVSSTTCSLAEGRGQLYGIDAITGAAIFNWDNDPNNNLGVGDRTYTLGSGIPSNPVPVFFPEKVMLLVGVGGGAQSVDPSIAIPSGRTYWFQEDDL